MVRLKPFDDDLRTGREDDLRLMRRALLNIGDESRLARTLPRRRALAVLEALHRFDRKTLPAREIASLVDVETQRIYQIEKGHKDPLTDIK